MNILKRWLVGAGAALAGVAWFVVQYLQRQRDRYREKSRQKARELADADEHRQASERVQKAQKQQRQENADNAEEQKAQRRSGKRPDRFGDRRL